MKIYMIRATRKIDAIRATEKGEETPARYFATSEPSTEQIVEVLRKKNPGLNIELHAFDIKTTGKNASKLFEELPF